MNQKTVMRLATTIDRIERRVASVALTSVRFAMRPARAVVRALCTQHWWSDGGRNVFGDPFPRRCFICRRTES
jgi:hypothetical protein